MISKAKQLYANPLMSGTILMFFGSNFANFFAYIYHFAMGRILGTQDYGELVAFLSLLGLLSTIYSFSGLVIIKFVSSAKEELKEDIYRWFTQKAINIGIISGLFITILIPFFAHFLHMPISLLIFLPPMYLIWLLSFVYRSVLQGLLKFFQTIIAINANLIGRLAFGVVLVFMGLSISGATIGLLLGSVLSFSLSRYFLKSFSESKRSTYKPGKDLLNYGLAVFVYTLATTSFFSTDLLLVKHYFGVDNSFLAGIYGSVSVLGKTVLYASGPIATVMFPLVSKKHSEGEEYKKVFLLSLAMTAAVALCVVVIFALIPDLLITMLYGSQFIEAAQYLFPYGLFIGLFTLSSLFASYYLSHGKTKVVWIFLTFAILQIIGIILFHATLMEVINVSILTTLVMFVTLLLYFANEKRFNQ